MTAEHATVKNWSVDRLDDLTGKTFFITGANSGVGFEAAKFLRRANADVIVGARSTDKGSTAVEAVRGEAGTGTVELVRIDLADTASIRKADAALRELTDGLDAVVNNAGIMQTPQRQTADGFELQFGTNHLGHFLMNHLTFDLVEARAGRIVPVGSIVHLRAKGIDFDDPMLTKSYSPSAAYTQSKLANLLYGRELARRLEAAGRDVIAPMAHPGYSATNLQSTGPTGLLKIVYSVSNLLAQSAKDGAVPEVLAAAGNEARNGAYYGPTRFGDSRGPVGDSTLARVARDDESARRLWALSEELLGIEWTIE